MLFKFRRRQLEEARMRVRWPGEATNTYEASRKG